MKKNMKFKVMLFIILTIIVVCLFFFFNKKEEVNNPESNIDNPSEEQNNEVENKPDEVGTNYLNDIKYTVKVDKEIEDVIVEFLNVYYNSIKELKENDMTYLFKDSTSEQALINQTALSLLIETRKLKPNELSLDKAKYDLDFIEVNTNGNAVNVTVLENNYLNFNFMKEIESKIYNIENEFTLEKVDGKYKITKYNKVQDFFVMITDLYSGGGKTKLDQIKQNYLDLINDKLKKDRKDYNDFLNGTGINRKTCDHEYNREEALKQTVWVNKRDPEWMEFDSNCQNFASQVLYSGGIPMDYTGSASQYLQWKGYDYSYNESETASGLVYTWTYVPYFREYALNNKGYGLCATVDENLYYAEAGDVIHVGTTGPTRHALVVIGDYKKDGKTIDILVNSNTVDLENYPISAYSYPYVSLIKVYGWNE